MGITALLTIGSSLVSAIGGFVQASQAAKAAQEQADIAAQNFALQNEELTRQQREENEAANERRSDRVRQANAELGALRVASAESGLSGQTFEGLAIDLAYVEGLDLSRIEKNREGRVASLQSQKETSRLEAVSITKAAFRRASAARTSAFLGLAGSVFKAGSKLNSTSQTLAQAQNLAG